MTALPQGVSASEPAEGPGSVLGEGLPCNCPVLIFSLGTWYRSLTGTGQWALSCLYLIRYTEELYCWGVLLDFFVYLANISHRYLAGKMKGFIRLKVER